MIINQLSLSLEEKVYSVLEEEILTGKLKAGEQLKEQALSAKLGVSRTPIRSALHRLAEDGLVEISANRGATVVGVSAEDVRNIYLIRERLEGLASRLAAERIDDEGKAELKNSVELAEFYISRMDAEKLKEQDTEFHKIIYEASGNRPLCKTLSDLHKNIKSYRKNSLLVSGRVEKSVAEHREILEAILAGDADEADRLTSLHIKRSMENILGSESQS